MKSCQYKSSDELPLILNVRLLKRDDFPHTVSGQRVYIDKGKFLSWLDAQTQMEKRDHYGW